MSGAGQPEVPAGRVGRPHGLDGSFYVTRPLADALKTGVLIGVGGRELAIERRAGTDRRPIVRVEGVSSREAAQALRGAQLTVARERLPRLPEGEWWAHELEGLRVLDGELELGRVVRMIALPTCEALQVSTDEGELIVPMVSDAVRRIDVAAGTVEVDASFLGET